ncbi:hypothetical protein [Brevundimonas sp.]|uniref:hypothetical protein n=1 Tax=Brevundimonas sp. TaxID=1871086 RepID=UPI001A331B49|nr:hypothetical protein [Brevundimonas sp.]MBJ7483514.1 hypothetical protein [Brevundimonas sp.]
MAGSPYFPPLEIAGEILAFDHLEPFVLEMVTQSRPNGVKIDVRFSNHCFSEAFDAARHGDDRVQVWDGPRQRVFCPIRYGLSLALPHIMDGLPTAHIYQTPEANFLRIGARSDGGAGDYRVFFRVRRNAEAGVDLRLFVESAYSPEPGQALAIAHMSKVRFSVLIDKTLKGEKLKFHGKR